MKEQKPEENAAQMLMASFTQASQAVDTMYVPLIKRFKAPTKGKAHLNDAFMLKEEIKCLRKLKLHQDMLIVSLLNIEDKRISKIGEDMFVAFELIFRGDRTGYKQFSVLAQDMIDESNYQIPDSVMDQFNSETKINFRED